MNIYVTHGSGRGRTYKSAFDAALWDAGIANYNILELSSVVPNGSNIEVKKIDLNEKNNHAERGFKLYAVLAYATETKKDKEAWAGIGWIQNKKDKGGLFVEHHGSSKEEVEKLIIHSLEDMKRYRKEDFEEIRMKLHGIKCEGEEVCSLVSAVFETEDWKRHQTH